MSLRNKVTLVTGGSSGIGAAIARLFTKEGAKVVIVGRNETKLNNVSTECEKLGSKPLIILGDISKDPDAKRIMDTTMNKLGQLDVLVNNAGFGEFVGIGEINAMQIFDKVMATNIRAVVHLTNLAAPHLVERKGNIVNISSIAALGGGLPRTFPYCTSKAALDHFSRCVAQELAPKGVRCNIVNPGPVLTDMIETFVSDKTAQNALWESLKQNTALKRISDASEIADLVLFLASDKAKGITGASFVSDNGMLLRG